MAEPAAISAAASPASMQQDSPASFLATLTRSCSVALEAAVQSAASSLSAEQRAQIAPESIVDATRAALKQVLEKRYSHGIAAACCAPFPSATPDPNQRTLSPAAEQPAEPVAAPKQKPVRAYIDGCFDIMHSGHYNAIRQAKALTDILVVGVHSDAEIRRHKGPPVMSDEERLATVRACKWVDEVVFDTPYEPSLDLLIKLDCDFCVHGDDFATTSDGRDAFAAVKAAGRMKVVKRTEGVSTTDLVGRLLLMTRDHHLAKLPALATASGVARPAAAAALPPSVDTDSISAKPISNFLPTTWRISQFSSHKTPSPTDTIVYIDGAFDLFHVGHIDTLKRARELGSFLYVGVHDDATVNLHKGRNYPIMNLHERVMNVLSCKYVDEVVIGAPWTVTRDLITSLNLHVVCSGSNTKMDADVELMVSPNPEAGPAGLPDAYAEAKALGIFREIETTHTLATEDVVKRLIKNREEYEQRNAKRAPKEQAYLTNDKQFIAEI